tara:strand:+ start:1 stop:924 length:924 start_codon:yes stop_codon:yes gene_type:complete
MKRIKPIFWKKRNILSFLFIPLSIFTYLINLFKKILVKKNFSIKTICVGNIYVGGTGKTPLSIKINNMLKKKYKTVFIKKKYNYQYDEQNLLKTYGNVIIANQRKKALKIAQNNKYNIAIMDDGLQEKSINYDITIACFNTSEGIGNGLIIPSGPLRENISEIKNYDAVFLNGEKKNIKLNKLLKKINKNLKIFEGKYVPLNLKKFNRNKNFITFSGLGNPDEFEKTLKKYKFKIKEKLIFPDHHKFSNSEIIKIKKIAKNKNLEIVTSEKDYYRLNKKNKKNIKFLKIELQIKNKKKFSQFIENKI